MSCRFDMTKEHERGGPEGTRQHLRLILPSTSKHLHLKFISQMKSYALTLLAYSRLRCQLSNLFVLLATAGTLADAEFRLPYNTERDKSGPMPPSEAVAKMKLQQGIKAT